MKTDYSVPLFAATFSVLYWLALQAAYRLPVILGDFP